MNTHDGGSAPFAPSVYDIEFENLLVYWREEGIEPSAARILALYQFCGGNAFGMLDLSGTITYAERPLA